MDQAADFPAKVRAQLKLARVAVPMCQRVAGFHLIQALVARAAEPTGNRSFLEFRCAEAATSLRCRVLVPTEARVRAAVAPPAKIVMVPELPWWPLHVPAAHLISTAR